MRRWMMIGLTCMLVLTAAVLVGCGGEQAASTDEVVSMAYTSDVLDTGYEGALDVGNQLALGTLRLEGTEHAVTAEQAKTLLPLWQALQGGVTAEGEISAVLRGIEEAMTEEQLAAIAGMQFTQKDVQTWMEEQGLEMGDFPGAGGDPDARATRQAESGGEGMPPGGEMPPEMATRMAEFESMSEEEREAMRATMQAGGGMPGGRASAAGAGQVGMLIRPLIELLTERAG